MRYEPILNEDSELLHDHTDAYHGENGTFGMDVAELFSELRDIRPARFAPNVKGGIRKPDDEDHIPEMAQEEREFDV